MGLSREWYVDTTRHWLAGLEDRWDEGRGHYRIPQSTRANAMLLAPMLVLFGEGEDRWQRRILRVAERMVQSPPYDEHYRYFNWNMDQTGGEIHSAGSMTQVGLSLVLRQGEQLGLPDGLRARIERTLHDSLERLAEFGLHATESDVGMAVEADGTPVDIGAERAEKVARGLPEDFGRLRQVGPSNQTCWEMRACVYAWEATRQEAYLDFVELLWKRVLKNEEGHRPYPACFSEDGSFIYTPRNPLWDYDQAMYDLGMFCQYADCVRVLRRAGRSAEHVERFMKHWGDAVFTRIVLADGSANMVYNSYGWERSSVGCAYGEILWLHPVIEVADLTPHSPGALKAMFERGAQRLRAWDFQTPFPPDLGLKGWISGQEEDEAYFPYELGLMILDHAHVVEVPSVPHTGCLSSLAWKEGHFVMQTPAYHATVIGTSPGYDGVHGIPTSGGEYVLRIPDGDYLFPLSDRGRASFGAVVEAERLDSWMLTKHNAAEYHFEMAVRLPDGSVRSQGEPHGPLLYEPATEPVAVKVSYGNEGVRLERELVFDRHRVRVTDRLIAVDAVTVDRAYSRIPLITVNPHDEPVEITATADGQEIVIRPPFYMGLADADYLYHDQDFIRSLRRLERLRAAFPGYGFEVRQLSEDEVGLSLTPWEWQENRRMRVSGKNLDYVWIHEPTKLNPGDRRELRYEIVPFRARATGPPWPAVVDIGSKPRPTREETGHGVGFA